MADDNAAFSFLAGAISRFAQLPHHRRIEAVAFVRTIEPDEGDLALELVGDRLFFAHELLLVSTGKSSPRRDHISPGTLRRQAGGCSIASSLRCRVPEQRRQQHRPLEIEADVVLVGESDRAVKLDASL